MRSKEEWAGEIINKLKVEKFKSPDDVKKFIGDIVGSIQIDAMGHTALNLS